MIGYHGTSCQGACLDLRPCVVHAQTIGRSWHSKPGSLQGQTQALNLVPVTAHLQVFKDMRGTEPAQIQVMGTLDCWAVKGSQEV